MTDPLRSILIIAVIAAVTVLLRFLPFLIFRNNAHPSPVITWLGQVLPYATMSMLVVYCLRQIDFTGSAHGLPELLACALVIALHFWKHNTLLSIFCGTVCYMLLIQFVF